MFYDLRVNARVHLDRRGIAEAEGSLLHTPYQPSVPILRVRRYVSALLERFEYALKRFTQKSEHFQSDGIARSVSTVSENALESLLFEQNRCTIRKH